MATADDELHALWSRAVAASPAESGPLWAEYDSERRRLAAARADQCKDM